MVVPANQVSKDACKWFRLVAEDDCLDTLIMVVTEAHLRAVEKDRTSVGRCNFYTCLFAVSFTMKFTFVYR